MNPSLLSLSFARHTESFAEGCLQKTGFRALARRGFTLIELLTVISIIAILMGLLFPAVQTVKDSARKTQAKNDVTAIVAAVRHYYTEYGKYPPMSTTAPTGDQYVGQMLSGYSPVAINSNLFYVLRGIDSGINAAHINNPRRIVFFEGRSVANPNQPKGGFLDPVPSLPAPPNPGSFFDPWGTQYYVMVDYNYDNVCDLTGVYSGYAATTSPRTGIVAWSVGKDGVPGSRPTSTATTGNKILPNSDDVVSWQ